MKRKSLFFCFILFTLFNCSDENIVSSDTEESTSLSFMQIPGCKSNEEGLLKTSYCDSRFSYSFNRSGTLDLEFCVYGNCCPDKDRFDCSHKIAGDTIFLAVADTAARYCDCCCKYDVEVRITGLKQGKYNLLCYSLDSEPGNYLYNEVVKRYHH